MGTFKKRLDKEEVEGKMNRDRLILWMVFIPFTNKWFDIGSYYELFLFYLPFNGLVWGWTSIKSFGETSLVTG